MDYYLEGVRVMTMLYVMWVGGEGSNTIFLQVAKIRENGGRVTLFYPREIFLIRGSNKYIGK